jgi:hypothetical protein
MTTPTPRAIRLAAIGSVLFTVAAGAWPAASGGALTASGIAPPAARAPLAVSRAALPPLPESHASAHAVQRQPPPGSCRSRGTGRFSKPDPRCTPGAIDPAVRQSNIDATICRSGYTRTVRPPESIIYREKRASMAAYDDGTSTSDYEYDHLVPLELGGAPNDPRNLWPEPGGAPNPKDSLENRLHRLVCAGALRLSTAQRLIARDWVGLYRQTFA